MKRLLPFLWLSGAMFLACSGVSGQDGPVFKVDVRLIEVYATVFDHRGRYLDGLRRESFEVFEDGKRQEIVAFEASSDGFSCAILLDSTGSMARTLPRVKNSIVKLIDAIRPEDAVGVYAFSQSVRELHHFTTDRAEAKRAVLQTRAEGTTALFDAIAEVARQISRRNGKKALVVFTDGNDNASLLNATSAWTRAKKVGVPVYTIAQGEALESKSLMSQLKEISQRTGGITYTAKNSDDIDEIFHDITGNLQHTYMLAYHGSAAGDQKWRAIQLTVKGVKSPKIQAKEGYYPD